MPGFQTGLPKVWRQSWHQESPASTTMDQRHLYSSRRRLAVYYQRRQPDPRIPDVFPSASVAVAVTNRSSAIELAVVTDQTASPLLFVVTEIAPTNVCPSASAAVETSFANSSIRKSSFGLLLNEPVMTVLSLSDKTEPINGQFWRKFEPKSSSPASLFVRFSLRLMPRPGIRVNRVL